MLKVKLTILFLFIAFFGAIFWFTQKDSFSKSANPNLASISLPPNQLTPILSAPPDQQGQNNPTGGQQTNEVQGPIKEDIRASFSAQIRTTKGTVTINLYNQEAKLAVKNFVTKAKAGYYKNLTFHRVEDWVVQGGDPKGNGTGGNAFQSELNGKSFVTGSLGWAAASNMQMGQGARISNDSQFFIVKSDAPWLDPTYTNFGIVTEGMNVVNNIKIGDKILDIIVEEE